MLIAAASLPTAADFTLAADLPDYEKDIQPIVEKYCYDCHGHGEAAGQVAFDTLKAASPHDGAPPIPGTPELWWKALVNVRAGLMPADGAERPTDAELAQLERWIKFVALANDADNPDPGRVTIRRLNRGEYQNTIRDLMGHQLNVEEELPADDTGYGFDNIGDVLTLSPLLMEKYMQLAEKIVSESVPTEPPGKDADNNAKRQYRRFFSKDEPPESADERSEYAGEVLTSFATKAFRRPVDRASVERLQAIAEAVYTAQGKRFEDGIAQAMIAVLASPRFLFRVEQIEPLVADSQPGEYPLVDEYSLASRLSYFLWSTMPDDQLMRLAERGELRKNLPQQIERMTSDWRFPVFSRNFVGQWLQARDVVGVAIDSRAVAARENEEIRALLAELRQLRRRGNQGERRRLRERIERIEAPELTYPLRRAMREETEMSFAHIVKENRSVLELIDADYVFVNEELAKHYGIEGVEGREVRRVELPKDSPRGGVLTQGTMLVVTSNPTRTSPVKRGLFVLENILGTPPPPPPPDIPALEAAQDEDADKELSTRQLMELHRAAPLCSSCHVRMDPLGLGLENFNAMGRWRDKDLDEPVDPSGELVAGERFNDVRELKKILIEQHRLEFYRCLTEKLLTYALGRGLTYSDVHTVDTIVERLERSGGKFSELLDGIIESAPFQRQREQPQPRTATLHGRPK